MPPFPPALRLDALLPRTAGNTTVPQAPDDALQVICAFPVSGQYGPGTRVLYYVLAATCVLARREELARKTCLAAALLFPAVAALHGVVLASVHIDEAVDMDVFGALQLCSIGVLGTLVTVRLSKTYFNDIGRNLIFFWGTLVLVGLLSLTVEFYRISTHPCIQDDLGGPISPNPSKFPYGNPNVTCGLVCSETLGPFSPIRGGSANNIYIIPAPDRLKFGAALLLSAACCIPAILLLVAIWLKMFENPDERLGKMKEANRFLKWVRRYFELPVFGAAILAILIVGEMNLFSGQVDYQTEPMANVGQWAPIAGIALALIGAIYQLLAEAMQEVERPSTPGHVRTDILHRTAATLIRISKGFGGAVHRLLDNPGDKAETEDPNIELPGNMDVRRRGRALSRIRTGSLRKTSEDGEDRDHVETVQTKAETFAQERTSAVESGHRPASTRLSRQRTDSLQVPAETHGGIRRLRTTSFGPDSPTIMVSSPDDIDGDSITLPSSRRSDPP